MYAVFRSAAADALVVACRQRETASFAPRCSVQRLASAMAMQAALLTCVLCLHVSLEHVPPAPSGNLL